jgi:hypothetical protein
MGRDRGPGLSLGYLLGIALVVVLILLVILAIFDWEPRAAAHNIEPEAE